MTLVIAPYQKPPKDRPIGLVMSERRVVGEWTGTTWKHVPDRALLYVNDARIMKPMYDDGQVEAIYWKKAGRVRNLSSWKWEHPNGHRHMISHLQGSLSQVPVKDRFIALLSVVQWVRDHGAVPASMVGMLNGLMRHSMRSTFRESSANTPGEWLWRGSRIERSKHFAVEFGRTDVWDMRSAFPRSLADIQVPYYWRHYEGSTLPDVESGFCRARVRIPWYMYGPLPDVSYVNPTFPIETELTGVWSLDELRIAQGTGCEVFPREYWIGHSYETPFAAWGRMINEMRAAVLPDAENIVKIAANRYVGRFAADGHRERSRFVNGDLHWIVEKGHKYPDSLTIHGLVTADVRSTMFVEGIWPYPAHFIFCHTDGVALMADPAIYRRPPPEGRWRVKVAMERLLLLNAQRYAYRGSEPTWRYVVAGIPEEVAEPFFLRRWGRLKDR